LADYLDGYLARLTHHVTGLGSRLDMEFDGLGVLVVSLLAVWYGQLPWWYLALGAVRYLFIFGLWWRKRQKLPIYEMAPSVHRRVFAGFHMSFLSVVLWPVIPSSGAMIAGVMFGGATAVSFLRDWLVMIGWLNPDSAVYRRTQQQIFRLMTHHLPFTIRVIIVLCLPILLVSLPLEHPAGWLFSWVGWIAGTAVFLGCMGRVFALLLIFPVWLQVVTYGITPLNGIILVCVIYLMLLGTGRFSWWQPEERYIARRAGENV
jgi:CDP-diacylglycerol--glycerol-3-phosphate 3-phosphatidyltransferase